MAGPDARLPVCSKTYTLEDFKIFDELKEPHFVMDFDPEFSSHIFGNLAICNCFNKTFEEFLAFDCNSGTSVGMRKWMDSVYHKVQLNWETTYELKTVHPSSSPTPVVLKMEMRPLQLKLPPERAEKYKWKSDTKVVLLVNCTLEGEANELEKKVATQARRSHELLSHIDVIASVFKTDGAFVSMNVTGEKYYWSQGKEFDRPCSESTSQSSSEEFVMSLGRIYRSCVWDSEEQLEDLKKKVNSLKIGDERIEVEVKKVPRGGDAGDIWHRIRFIPMLDPVEGFSCVLVMEQDITSLKSTEFELIAAQSAQQDFFAAISHELRTPLNGIIGLTESLIQMGERSPAELKTLKVVKSSGVRLSQLVNDILDAASLKQQKLVIKAEWVSIFQVAETVIDMLHPLVKGAVELKNLVDQKLPAIKGDSGRIIQIITNLVSNAIKFTSSGFIRINAKMVENHCIVEVSDSGIGIPSNKLDAIWGAFQQVDMSTTRKYGGTGLGLSLVKQLVEAHGGSVSVASNFGGDNHGSVFRFNIPKDFEEKTGDPPSSPAPRRSMKRNPSTEDLTTCGEKPKVEEEKRNDDENFSRSCSVESIKEVSDENERLKKRVHELEKVLLGNKSTNTNDAAANDDEAARDPKIPYHSEIHGCIEILSVDDNEVNHMVVENILTPRGFKITTCMSGVEALELLESRSFLPDLILLDCMMPVMSGFEVCQTLRRKHPQNALPIIMVSARSGDEDIVRGLSLGCNDYITKPFSAGELNARIDVQLKIRELWRTEIQKLGGWQARSERLPKNVKMRLKKGNSMIMDYHENVSVLICELVNMRRYAHGMEMDTFVHFLNNLYGTLDEVAAKHGVLPIFGDTYMVVTGHEARLGPSLAAGQNAAEKADNYVDPSISSSRRLIKVAMDFLKVADEMWYNLKGKSVRPRLRIGISTGEAYSGFVGSRNAHFTFFGTAIYEAWEMTSLGFHGCIHISQSTYDDLENRDDAVLFTDAPGRKSYLMKIGDFENVLELKKAEAQGTSVEDCPERLREDVAGQLTKPRVAAHQAYLNMIRQMHMDDKVCPNCKGSLAMICTKCRLGDDVSQASEVFDKDIKFHYDKFGKYEILSVDDDQVNQMVIENILRPSGYEVKVCMDGPEALAELSNRDYLPDLCLVDVMMPSMDGYEVVRKLRTLYPETLPIVMVSANLDIASDAQACGADAWDSKPLKAGAIVEKIQKTMELKKTSRRSSPDGRPDSSLKRSSSNGPQEAPLNNLQDSNKLMEEINHLRAELTVMQDKAEKLEEEKTKLNADLEIHILSNKQKEQEVSELKQARRDAEVRHMREMKESENTQKDRVRKDLVEKNKMVLNADSRSHDSKTDVFDNVQVVSTCLRCLETERKLEDACGRERQIMKLLVTAQTQHSQLQIAYCTLVNKWVGYSVPAPPTKPRTSTLELVELLEENDMWMDYDALKGMGVRKVEDILQISGAHLDNMAPVTANKVRRLQELLKQKDLSAVTAREAHVTTFASPIANVTANRSSVLASDSLHNSVAAGRPTSSGGQLSATGQRAAASKTELAVEAIGRALKVLSQSDSNSDNVSDDVRARLIAMLTTPKP